MRNRYLQFNHRKMHRAVHVLITVLDFKIGGIAARIPVNTQTPYDPNHPKIKRVEVYWHTVTYKTVAVYVVLLTAIILRSGLPD